MTTRTIHTLDDEHLKKVFIHNLNRIYFAKCYLDGKMQGLIDQASFTTLQQGMQEFSDDVKKQITRMKEIFVLLDETPSDKNCNPLRAIVKDEFCLTDKYAMPVLKDLDLIHFMQMLEHMNIASYRLLRTIAKSLNYTQIEQLLVECFDECVDNDELFVLISREYIGA